MAGDGDSQDTSTFGSLEPKDAGLPREIYERLRIIARARMAEERASHTLEATALVHEAYLRLRQRRGLTPSDTSRWLAAAAEELRRVLVDHARSRGAVKRGGGRARSAVDLESLRAMVESEDSEQILALDGAISRLQERDARAADVVRLRFFLGMSVDDAAEALGVSRRSVLRDWEFARAFLASDLVRAAGG